MHRGIIFLQKELLPENRERLEDSDEERIKAYLDSCCADDPRCGEQKECKRLHSTLVGLLPLAKRAVASPSRRRLTPGEWIPKINMKEIISNARSH